MTDSYVKNAVIRLPNQEAFKFKNKVVLNSNDFEMYAISKDSFLTTWCYL